MWVGTVTPTKGTATPEDFRVPVFLYRIFQWPTLLLHEITDLPIHTTVIHKPVMGDT